MRGQRPDHSLQATALVNEAYVRLVDVQQMNWQNRAHFLAMAARLMRRILVDSARARESHKRGGGAVRVSFSEELAVTDAKGLDMVVWTMPFRPWPTWTNVKAASSNCGFSAA
jgi:RNA polymerase sigma-70 factor (ECF subfamily)